ncbi:Hypothetical protein R9X50_00703600 [Acrodontium crateriforme]|uniref:MJ1316 RNA cyclic group end recognition domain-containing protein n=1 Tax=Acrodontium crateriforme TaxID=150365 RepID=A0AAQ3MAB5_9PEZI|nr:Hypothetical protein R9X50_00703600 [Acrodontium crateriforme]
MTDKHAKSCRAKNLDELGIEFPVWIFDVDQPSWPRKLADIPPNSRPAALTGWVAWPWEYGTGLVCVGDAPPPGVMEVAKDMKKLGSIQQVLDQLRYDDRFDSDTFDVVYDVGTGTQGISSKKFHDWEFESAARGFVAARRIVRIERKWDCVVFWNRDTGINLFKEGDGKSNAAYGMATFVHNDDELLRAAGVKSDNIGEKMRKAEIELLDGDKERVKGIIYPGKVQQGRGLYLNRGPDFRWNHDILSGTALQNAPWSDVEDHVMENKRGPLV